ncbi:hypothetical protein C9J21_16775 [Photobacterium phosphoreum]|nr:hypothetical protein C9J21_16775 [Photobacterium phosphoreum]
MGNTSDFFAIKNALKQTYKLNIIIVLSFVFLGFIIAYSTSYKWKAEKIVYSLNSSNQNKIDKIYFDLDRSSFDNKKLVSEYVMFFNKKILQSDFNKLHKLSNTYFNASFDIAKKGYLLKSISAKKEDAKNNLESYINYVKIAFIKSKVNNFNKVKFKLLNEYKYKLKKEIEIASKIKNKKLKQINLALYIAEKSGNKKPIINLDLNSSIYPVFNDVVMGSDILKEAIKGMAKAPLTLYSTKIAIYQYKIHEISNINMNINDIDIFNVKVKSGFHFEINGMNKSNIILLFFFIGLILSAFSMIFRYKVEI